MAKYEMISLSEGANPKILELICDNNVYCPNNICPGIDIDLVCECDIDEQCHCGPTDPSCSDKGCNCGSWSRTLPPIK